MVNKFIMKKLLIILFSLGIGFGASAQHGGHIAGGGVHYSRPRIIIGGGAYLPLSPYMGYGFGYNPLFGYGYPYNQGYRSSRPTKLDLQIEDIKNDYKDRIWSAKHDDTLSRKERKAKVHELKHERDDAITDAKRNYYKTKSDYKS